MFSSPPRKYRKVDSKATDGPNIIDLCSGDEADAKTNTLNDDKGVIALCGDESGCILDKPLSMVCNTDTEMTQSVAGTDERTEPCNISQKPVSDTQDNSSKLFEKNFEQPPAAFLGSGHAQAFFFPSPVADHDVPSRDVDCTKESATPSLLTARFFARAMSAITMSRPKGSGCNTINPSPQAPVSPCLDLRAASVPALDEVGSSELSCDLGLEPTLSVSDAWEAEHKVVDASVSSRPENTSFVEKVRVVDGQPSTEFGEVSDISQAKSSDSSSKFDFPMTCVHFQYFRRISSSRAIHRIARNLGRGHDCGGRTHSRNEIWGTFSI